jgi:hypothetical protein
MSAAVELENARKLIALENRAKAAVAELGKVSMALNSMDKDLKLSGWDWNRSSSIASIMPQGSVGVAIVNVTDRPVR